MKTCSCCGLPTLPEKSIFEICETCGWQDDGVQNGDPTYSGGANELCLSEYRRKWVAKARQLNSVTHFRFHYIDIVPGPDGFPMMK